MSILREVARRAAADSPLWRASLVRDDAPAQFEGRCPSSHLLGVEMIYEGYLLHRGRSRLFSHDDPDLALLTGDYLYAAGLTEICTTGDLDAVRDLAELISACACSQAEGTDDAPELWERTVAGLAASRPA
ncbi:MAG: hypothetical protein ACTHNU_17800 [Gaiellales bacterium]